MDGFDADAIASQELAFIWGYVLSCSRTLSHSEQSLLIHA